MEIRLVVVLSYLYLKKFVSLLSIDFQKTMLSKVLFDFVLLLKTFLSWLLKELQTATLMKILWDGVLLLC